jgi:hypothetical protein
MSVSILSRKKMSNTTAQGGNGRLQDSGTSGLHWTPGLHWIPRVQWSPGVHDKILHEQLLNFINYLQKNKEKI